MRGLCADLPQMPDTVIIAVIIGTVCACDIAPHAHVPKLVSCCNAYLQS